MNERERVRKELQDEVWKSFHRAPPLRPEAQPAPVTVLDSLAKACASDRERTIPGKVREQFAARYDGHDWWADSLPARAVIRHSVLCAVRSQWAGIRPKQIDQIVTAIIERAKKRGLRPKGHRAAELCGCDYCDRRVQQRLAGRT